MEQRGKPHCCTHPVWDVILAKLTSIEEMFGQSEPIDLPKEKQWFNMTELIEYLPSHPVVQTVYGWTRSHKNQQEANDRLTIQSHTKSK